MHSGQTRAFGKFALHTGERRRNLGLLGSDSGVLDVMDLDARSNVARFGLNSPISCLHYFDALETVVLGFESGLVKSFALRLNKSARWQVESRQDLVKHFSLGSKVLVQGKHFLEKVEHNDHELVGLQVLKVFSSAVTRAVASERSRAVVFRSARDELFFMKTRVAEPGATLRMVPLFLLQLQARVHDCKFLEHSGRLLFALATGQVFSVGVPDESHIDNQRNFLLELGDARLQTRAAELAMMEFQKPQLDENDLFYVLNGSTGEELVEWDPQPVSAVLEVACPESLAELAQAVRAQAEEARRLDEHTRQDHAEPQDPEARGPPAVQSPAAPVESVKVGDSADLEAFAQKHLALAASQGNFLGYLYLLELRVYTGGAGVASVGRRACVRRAVLGRAE